MRKSSRTIQSGSNPSDDRDVSILEDFADDPTYQELVGAMEALNQDQLRDLVALAWVGRGTYGREEWAQARRQALDIPLEDIPRYLTGIPLLGTFLEEGLSQLGYSCEDVEDSAAFNAGVTFAPAIGTMHGASGQVPAVTFGRRAPFRPETPRADEPAARRHAPPPHLRRAPPAAAGGRGAGGGAGAAAAAAARTRRRHRIRPAPRLRAVAHGRRLPGGRAAAPLRGLLARLLAAGFPRLDDVQLAGTHPLCRAELGHHERQDEIPAGVAAMVAANRRAALDVLVHHLANRPRSRVLAGRSFVLGGSTALVEAAPGVHAAT